MHSPKTMFNEYWIASFNNRKTNQNDMTITKVYVQQLVNAGKLKDVTPEKKRNKKYISVFNN